MTTCLCSHLVPVLEFLRSFGIDVTVVLFAASHVLGIITLQSLDVENVAERASVRSRDTLDADVELPAIGRVSVSRVMARLFNF